LKIVILVFLVLLTLSSCSSSQKTQSGDIQLVDLKIEQADLGKYQTEDSLLAVSNSPFSPSTRLVFSVLEKDSVEIEIYNHDGDLISQTFKDIVEEGDYLVQFDGTNFLSGVYFIRYKIGNQSSLKKFMFIK
jgi:hypothetical protein